MSKDTTMDDNDTTTAIRKAQANRNNDVLIHLTAAAQRISPCPDDGRLHPADGEVADAFRAAHGRWPLWWEMAVATRAASLVSAPASRAGRVCPHPDQVMVERFHRAPLFDGDDVGSDHP